MNIENLSTLKIHKLTEDQYNRELETGRIDPNAIYLTPDEAVDTDTDDTLSITGMPADAKATGDAISSISHLIGDAKVSEQISTAIHGSVANWSQTDPIAIDYIKNKPSTVEGYGITELPVNLLSGVIPIEKIPHGALERCVVILDSIDRFKLTKGEVQIGDTVKEDLSGKMYFVVDDTKLNSDDGYVEYTAGTASSVNWSGVQNKPTTLSGYGITDAVNNSDVTTTATANKILKLDSNKKLPASITGDAATVGGKGASDFVLASDVTTIATANKLLKLNANGKLPANITGSAGSIDGVTATATELNYVDGVTSNVQTQLDSKLELNQKTRINSGADLNSYTTPGTYVISMMDDGRKISNTPYSNACGTLVVSSMRSPKDSPITGVYQTFYGYNGIVYYRTTGNNSTWTNWKNYVTNILTSNEYGDTLPAAGNAGRIFFKKVSS